MNKSAYFWIAAAVFAGAFGAMQADRWIRERNGADRLPLLHEAPIRPVNLEGAGGVPFDFREAAKRVNQSVVSVDRFERFQRGFFDRTVVEAETGSGSGVILDSTGVIVTNNHVVEQSMGPVRGEDPKVRVRLSDGRAFDARILGRDPRSDLAVLKINATGLKPIEMGTSSNVEIGQWVMAVGNPLGFENTVSVGVVSSLKRNLPVGRSGLVDAIQTDAAINPGNSGGALTDAQGRLIGINSAIASGTGMSVGIGFAIPVDRVRKVVNDIVTYGEARYAGLGIRYNPEFDGALGNPFFRAQVEEEFGVKNLPRKGILVIEPGAEMARVGAKPGSVILSIDDTEVNGSFDLNRALVPRKPGDIVTVKFWTNGETKTARVKLVEIRQTV
jgi:putative serine protease PepD